MRKLDILEYFARSNYDQIVGFTSVQSLKVVIEVLRIVFKTK